MTPRPLRPPLQLHSFFTTRPPSGRNPLIERPKLIAAGLVVPLLSALVLTLVLAFLQFTEALVAAERSTVELLELYVIELVAFAVAIYVLYRLGLGILGPPPGKRDDEPARSDGKN